MLRSTIFCGLLFVLGSTLSLRAQDQDPPAPTPENDAFAQAKLISGNAGSVTGSNLGATPEPGEPSLFSLAGASNSVWYRWVAPWTGRWSFDTDSSEFDTLLAVFAGTNFSGLETNLLAANNDVCPGDTFSQVSFPAIGGQEYRVLIDGVQGGQGPLVLSWVPNPVNDDFTNAIVISGDSGALSGSNIGAGVEPGEPTYTNFIAGVYKLAGASVWYRWTAPRSARMIFDTASSKIDTVLGAFAGPTVSNLVLVAANDNNAPDGSSTVQFSAEASVTYAVAVNSRFVPAKTERFALHWMPLPAQPPPNDNFANAQTISGSEGRVTGWTFAASREEGEPIHASSNSVGASIWYRWTAPADGPVLFDAANSSFNSRLAFYSGASLAELTAITNNEDSAMGPFLAHVIAGTTYCVAVDGYLDLYGNPPFYAPTGRVDLHWIMPASAPANDAFSNALLISGLTGSVSGSNLNATNEPGEPWHGDNEGGASVWYRWTAPATGRFTFDTAGSGFDTLLAVYTGSTIANLNCLGSNDDWHNPMRTSGVSFNANAGMEYLIAIDGYLPIDGPVKTGRYILNWSLRYPDALPSRPRLSIATDPAGGARVISWPDTFPGFILQASPECNSSVNWSNITDVVTAGGLQFHTNASPRPAGFFRLVRP